MNSSIIWVDYVPNRQMADRLECMAEGHTSAGGGAEDLTEEQLEFLASMFDLARNGNAEELLPLIDKGVPSDLTNDRGDTLLILAAYNVQAEVVRGLLERQANVDRVNDRGQTALGCAVFRQHEDITRMLLDAGANPALGAQSAYAVVEMFNLASMATILDEYR